MGTRGRWIGLGTLIASVGRGTVWKWSKIQIDSKPSRSACRATSVVRRHASSGP
jgi:hypothetical protein